MWNTVVLWKLLSFVWQLQLEVQHTCKTHTYRSKKRARTWYRQIHLCQRFFQVCFSKWDILDGSYLNTYHVSKLIQLDNISIHIFLQFRGVGGTENIMIHVLHPLGNLTITTLDFGETFSRISRKLSECQTCDDLSNRTSYVLWGREFKFVWFVSAYSSTPLGESFLMGDDEAMRITF